METDGRGVHRRVVVTAAGTGHRAFDAQSAERLLIGIARILTAEIRLVQELASLGGVEIRWRGASHTNSVARDVLRDQPTTLRLNKSTTTTTR